MNEFIVLHRMGNRIDVVTICSKTLKELGRENFESYVHHWTDLEIEQLLDEGKRFLGY